MRMRRIKPPEGPSAYPPEREVHVMSTPAGQRLYRTEHSNHARTVMVPLAGQELKDALEEHAAALKDSALYVALYRFCAGITAAAEAQLALSPAGRLLLRWQGRL